MGSGFRFSSFFGSPLPSPVAAAALPTINNHILRKHLDAVNTLQQRMLEAELHCRPGGKAAANTADEQVQWLLNHQLPLQHVTALARLLLCPAAPVAAVSLPAGTWRGQG